MRLKNISAVPHPAGNRIDLEWINPDPQGHPGICVVRREGAYPVSANPAAASEGVVVPLGGKLLSSVTDSGEMQYSLKDENLKGETVYYYALFPYRNDPNESAFDRHHCAAAMATAPHDMAGQMYELLPAIYHRYDTAFLQPDHSGGDKPQGQLRRFLALPGGQLDQLYSHARALLDAYDLNKTDGRLLPLLAQWIGWQTDHRLGYDGQRAEIRGAPHVYKTIGIIPTVEATVKRIFGWESRSKEFVHNVFLSNRPERLNLWLTERISGGEWSKPAAPLSIDFAYEGQPAAVRDGDGKLWLFYHTSKKGGWEIWYKIKDGAEWTPSQPLSAENGSARHPAAALQGGKSWVFWDSYDENLSTWRIRYRCRENDRWSPITPFELAGDPEEGVDRRRPCVVTDDQQRLWLFWLEKTGGDWRMRFSVHNGNGWLPKAQELPGNPGIDDDPFVLFNPADAGRLIWVFWARRVPTGAPNQTRWQIAYRFKKSLDPAAADWSDIAVLPEDAGDADDREPAAVVANAKIDLYWSSTRDGSWSIWRATLDDAASNLWGPYEPVTGTPFSQRAPLPVASPDGLWLFHRSNESLNYVSTVYRATETVDARYAGSTSVDTRNLSKTGLRGLYSDFQTYTYDTGLNGELTDRNWYARDTVGIYLTPSPEDHGLILQNRQLLERVLRQFLPIQIRLVFILQSADREIVYTYGFPNEKEQRYIGEEVFDSQEVFKPEDNSWNT